MSSGTTGYANTALGTIALNNNVDGHSNTAAGVNALFSNTIGYLNCAFGVNALLGATGGSDNTAIGSGTLFKNQSSFMVAVGSGALNQNTTGERNNAVGTSSMQSNTTGSDNTAFGTGALINNLTGNQNTMIGNIAGSGITGGFNNICIGYNAQSSSATASNETVIGSTGTVSAKIYGQPYQTVAYLVGDKTINNTQATATAIDMEHSIYNITGDNGFNGFWFVPDPSAAYEGCTINFRAYQTGAASGQGWYITTSSGRSGTTQMIAYNQTNTLVSNIRVIYSSQIVCMMNAYSVYVWFQTFTVNT